MYHHNMRQLLGLQEAHHCQVSIFAVALPQCKRLEQHALLGIVQPPSPVRVVARLLKARLHASSECCKREHRLLGTSIKRFCAYIIC